MGQSSCGRFGWDSDSWKSITKIVEVAAREDASPAKSTLESAHFLLLWVSQDS